MKSRKSRLSISLSYPSVCIRARRPPQYSHASLSLNIYTATHVVHLYHSGLVCCPRRRLLPSPSPCHHLLPSRRPSNEWMAPSHLCQVGHAIRPYRRQRISCALSSHRTPPPSEVCCCAVPALTNVPPVDASHQGALADVGLRV